MDEFFDLLHKKNKCLEKFYKINKSELINFKKGIFKNIENFYEKRESILNKIKKIDYTMGSLHFNEGESEKWEEERLTEVQEAITHRSQLVTEIVLQDLHILSFVEGAKTKMIEDLVGMNTAQEDFIKNILHNEPVSEEEDRVDRKTA